jgi:hypothetical protein
MRLDYFLSRLCILRCSARVMLKDLEVIPSLVVGSSKPFAMFLAQLDDTTCQLAI